MAQNLENLLTLLVGAGWSDKKVRDTLKELRNQNEQDMLKVFRAYRRGLGEAQKKHRSKEADTLDMAVSRSLKLLRSVGPYTETEILEALNKEAANYGLKIPTLVKGGIRTWLAAFGAAAGADKMKQVVACVRNDLVHNPRPGWSVKDVK